MISCFLGKHARTKEWDIEWKRKLCLMSLGSLEKHKSLKFLSSYYSWVIGAIQC